MAAIGRIDRALSNALHSQDRSTAIRLLLESAVFDPIYYSTKYPDVSDFSGELAEHFLDHGFPQGRQPNRYLDPNWYLRQYPDVKDAGTHPLIHYILYGDREGRQPSPFFASQWYRDHYALSSEENALLHYLRHRRGAIFSPIPQFDVTNYARSNKDLVERRVDLFEHFLLHHLGSGQMVTWGFTASEPYMKNTRRADDVPHVVNGERQGAIAGPPASPSLLIDRVRTIGTIDAYGYHRSAGGWLLCGFVPSLDDGHLQHMDGQVKCRLRFEDGEMQILGSAALYRLTGQNRYISSIALFVPCVQRFEGELISADLAVATQWLALVPDDGTRRLEAAEVASHAASVVEALPLDSAIIPVIKVREHEEFTGVSTLDQLSDIVHFEVDEAIHCPPDGVVLIGWHLAAPGAVVAIRVRRGDSTGVFNHAECVRINRPDVLDAVGRACGLTTLDCGFIAFIDGVPTDDRPMYIEIETRAGEIGFKTIPRPRLRGMTALRRILDTFEVSYDAVRPAFDKVVGPAFLRLNRDRIQERPTVSETLFGTQPETPKYTVIVPLYGRVDLVEYQLALIALGDGGDLTEFIYVLDDPPRASELLTLGESLYARFGLPLRFLVLSHNMGFAPACNIGLSRARGELVCFLNSDVFCETPNWLRRLSDRLLSEPDLGAIGPLLLYEDGGIQHEGMTFERVPRAGDLFFAMHRRKGWRPEIGLELVREAMITGACIVISRHLATALQGFSEAYAIGDFEDVDLCQRIRQRGFVCAVDHSVRMYHLERKSQESSEQLWRRNLTLCNAWYFNSRWSPETHGKPAETT